MPSITSDAEINEANVFLRLNTSTKQSFTNSTFTTYDWNSRPSLQEFEKKKRFGSFSWPSGAHYEGEFCNGQRNGRGTQTWKDGSEYKGEFVNDVRHGIGVHRWKAGEVYEGQFYKDHRHGKGSYCWPDGTKYSGTFFLDRKEGYGVFLFSNGDKFEGLYKEDERFGPGVLTYKDMESKGQEVGVWHREKLLKICVPTGNVFTMEDHPEYVYFPKEHRLNIDLTNNYESDAHKVFVKESASFTFLSEEFKSSLFAENTALPPGIERYSKDFEHLPLTEKHMVELDKAFFAADYETMVNDSKDRAVVANNNTPLMMEIQKHIHKHRNRCKTVSFDVKHVIDSQRSSFNSKLGCLEVMSKTLIEMATEGDYRMVYSILKAGLVDPSVADDKGNMALIGAAVNCHHDIVNLLLDMGANVNQLNDEGVSALTACHIFYYPIDHFKPNQPEISANINRKMMQRTLNPVKKQEAIRRRATGLTPQSSPKPFDPFQKRHSQEKDREQQDSMLIFSDHLASGKKKRDLHKGFDKALGEVIESYASPEVEKKNIETCKSDVRIMNAHRESLSAKGRRKSFDKKNARLLRMQSGEINNWEADTEESEGNPTFDSNKNQVDFDLDITDELIKQTATLLSMNERAVSGVSTRDGQAISLGTTAALAVWKAEHKQLRDMINLLLRRGSDPNVGTVPFPALFFAVKAGDVEAVKGLLAKGATTKHCLSDKLLGFSMLHIACGIMCPEGVKIVALLLNANADPNAFAKDEDIPYTLGKKTLDSDGGDEYEPGKSYQSANFLNFETQWITDGLKLINESGRTPLHVACDRDDDYDSARKIVRLLLTNGACPDVVWSGHSPLSLAVASGNDKCINELLCFGADASLPLTRGVGNALCAAADPKHEHRRTPEDRLKLVDKLIEKGANILAPVSFGAKKLTGTVVDYAHWMFVTDKRIAHTPYHALSIEERETYTARKQLIARMGDLLREAAVNMESSRLKEEFKDGIKSCSPSRASRFLYTGAGAEAASHTARPSQLDKAPTASSSGPEAVSELWMRSNPTRALQSRGSKYEGADEVLGVPVSKVSFVHPLKDNPDGMIPTPDDDKLHTRKDKASKKKKNAKPLIRKPLFRYCYDCGRSVGVKLTACSRCHEVFFCSRACKLKSWEVRHKNECLRLKGCREQSPMPTPSELAAIFAVRSLDDTMERARVKTDSIIDTILGQQLLIAEENAILAAQRNAMGTRQSRVTTGRASARFRGTESTTTSRRALSSKKSSKGAENKRSRGSSKQNPAKVSAKTRSKVGKDVTFGTTGMTLAELGIVENYSFE